MSKMNDLYLDKTEAQYELYVEEQRMELRREGAEEMRIEIVRALDAESKRTASKDIAFGLKTAIVVAEQATI